MKTTTRNACILFAVAGAAAIIAFAIIRIKDNEPAESVPQNVFADLPEAEEMEITESKSEAYLRDSGERSKIEDYWNQCSQNEDISTRPENSSSGAVSASGTASTEDLLGLNDRQGQSSAPRSSAGNPYRETPAERETRHQRRHEEALELAGRIQEGQQPRSNGDEGFNRNETIPLPDSKVRRSDIISSLDDWEGDGGFSSLDNGDIKPEDDPYTPFRCMFARESKLTDGQRVTVILLDDLTVSGISVPRNTHLMATCQISNRLELEFNNIEIGGRILALGFEAYDIDGSKGIYCPDVGSAGKTVKNRGANIISSSLSSRLGRVARDVASTGISLIQNADGQRTVSVPAGYTFFIIKKRLD